MKTAEIFALITSQPKWYADLPNLRNKLNGEKKYHTPQSANRIKARFYAGRLSAKNIEIIFNHFGYSANEIIWKKDI